MRVPRTVPQGQDAVEFLDVDLLADLVHPDDVGRVVPLTLGTTDGPRVLEPPLVVLAIARLGIDGSRGTAPELAERVALVRRRGLDGVTEPEVAGGARELGLPVDLLRVEDRRLLVDADAK